MHMSSNIMKFYAERFFFFRKFSEALTVSSFKEKVSSIFFRFLHLPVSQERTFNDKFKPQYQPKINFFTCLVPFSATVCNRINSWKPKHLCRIQWTEKQLSLYSLSFWVDLLSAIHNNFISLLAFSSVLCFALTQIHSKLWIVRCERKRIS